MNKKEAIRRLQGLLDLASLAEEREALRMAIEALQRQPNYKKEGAKGGRATLAKHGKKAMTEWGKLGGRPRKKKM